MGKFSNVDWRLCLWYAAVSSFVAACFMQVPERIAIITIGLVCLLLLKGSLK